MCSTIEETPCSPKDASPIGSPCVGHAGVFLGSRIARLCSQRSFHNPRHSKIGHSLLPKEYACYFYPAHKHSSGCWHDVFLVERIDRGNRPIL